MADQNNPYGTTPQPLFGGNPQSVADLYQQYLGRAPEAEGLAHWQQRFGSTIDPNEIAAFKAVADANISKGIEQGPGSAAAITNLYQQYLGRAPEAEGLAHWQQQFGPNLSPEEAATFKTVADANISKGIEQGPETSAAIANLYQQYLGRAADPEGMMHWKQQFGTNLSPEEAATFQKIAQENLDKGVEKGAAYYSSLTPTTVSSSVEDLYLQDKLQQLANDPQALQLAKEIGWTGKTTQELKDFMQSFGMTPYQHYQKYGKQEGVDWRKQNLEDVYLEQKLAQLANDPNAQARAQELGWTGGTPEELKSFMQSLGLTPFEYYQKYGLQEGLQFSGFDAFGGLEDAYLQQKLDQLAKDQQAQEAAKQIGWTGSTAGELKNFMQSLGMTPYQHYQKYGKQEGLSWAQPDFEEQPQQAKLEGILSGFEALGKGEFTEDQVKNFIGQDKFNEYKDQFSGALKSGIANILADNSLSGQEVMSAVQTARKYGLDNDEISNLTGYDKSLFDEINKGYDTTVNSLVDKALEGKEGLGDKVKTNLALQLQYGLTDEDLAKASDMTTDQVKGLLDPVRNFGTQYKDVISKPDAASKDILSFIDTAKNNQAIDSIYGDKLDALKQQVELANEKWKGSGLDGYQAENVYQGINSRTNENYLRGAAFGGAEGKAKELTKFFVNSGITNINDLGVRPVPIDPENPEGALRPEFYNKKTGKPLKSSGNIVYAADIAAGYDPKISSGQWKGIAPGQNLAFGQTWEGKGSTTFNVAFDKNLNPIFNSYGNSTSSLPELAPLLTIGTALLAPAVGGYISSALASAGGSSLAVGTLANTALTQGIMSGGMAALTGGDVGKSFVGGAIGAPIAQGISSMLPTGMDPNLAKMATNVGTSAATSALAGRPMNLQGALINTGLQYGAQQLPWNLTPQQVNLLAGVATPYLQGQSISPTQLSGILANYAIKSQMPQKGAR